MTGAWQVLEHSSRRTEVVSTAQLRMSKYYPFIELHDSTKIIHLAQIASGCVNVLSRYDYETYSASEAVFNIEKEKLPNESKKTWISFFPTRRLELTELAGLHCSKALPKFKRISVYSTTKALANLGLIHEKQANSHNPCRR